MSDRTNNRLNTNEWRTILLIIALPLMFAFASHLIGSFYIVKDFFSAATADLNISKPFTAIMWLMLAIITLFTPTKRLKSPLAFLSGDIAAKWQALKMQGKDLDSDTKFKKRLEIVITVIYLVIMTSAYYYIIKNIVQYDENYQIVEKTWILTLLYYIIVIAVFLSFTSYIVWKLEDIEENNEGDHAERQKQKTIYSIVLITWVLTSIGIWNGISTYVSNYVKKQDNGIIKSIYDTLGGDQQSLWDWKDIDIFDDKN